MAAILIAAAGTIGFIAPSRAATTWNVGVFDDKFVNGTCEAMQQGSVTAITAGDSVTWTNCSDLQHNVTSDDGKFPLKSLPSKGSTATQQFPDAGTYGYKCTLHGFSGTVVVDPVATPTTPAPTAPPTTPKPTTTSSTSTTVPRTTTTFDISGGFTQDPTSSTTPTTGDPTVTTRALGAGGENGSSAGVVAALLVGIGAVGTAAALIIRRMRGGPVAPS